VQHRWQRLAQRVGRPAQHGPGLCKITLQEVRFSQHDPNGEFVLAGQGRRPSKEGRQQLDGPSRLPALERGGRAGNNWLKGGVGHVARI
jgi:hypothetical protein